MMKLLRTLIISFILAPQLIHCTFAQFMRKLPVYGKHVPTVSKEQVANIENINVLTMQQTPDCPEINRRTIHEVCTAIKDGHNAENNNTCVALDEKLANGQKEFYKLSTEIPSNYDGVIAIYVPGYAGLSGNARYKYAGSGAYGTFNYLKANFMPKDWLFISFDGQVSYRSYFNFGQQLDQDCLNTVYEATIQKNPNAKIVLLGSCKGATTILNYLTNPVNKDKQFNKHIKAVLLESPSISLETIVEHIARHHVPRPLQFILPYLFAATFPNYQWGQKTMIDNAANLPDDIPIFIGYLQQDKTADYKDVLQIFERFTQAGKNNITIFKSGNTELLHGHLSKAKDFQENARTFLEEQTK